MRVAAPMGILMEIIVCEERLGNSLEERLNKKLKLILKRYSKRQRRGTKLEKNSHIKLT